MLPQKTKSRADELRRRLACNGWEVVEVEQPFEREWWAAEFWTIESIWSPHGVRVILTFLVDPMGGREQVWAVHAAPKRPQQRPLDDNPLLSLGHAWQTDVTDFCRAVDRLRAGSPPESEREG